MTHNAQGRFKVTIAPLELSEIAQPSGLGRLSIDKRFEGPLAATSQGEMLSGMGSVKGSAGYVAMETVRGTLDGRRGSFMLQHLGTMDRGTPSLSVTVVPDSGTDELAGLTGRMRIDITGGEHFYDFDYELKTGG
jgi:hypothetical protein